ncbi:MAG: trigger factor [Patescibacteria group bacterium]
MTKFSSTLAKSEDGVIQINITIPQADIKKAEEEVITETASSMEVSGFRKGKAPPDMVKAKISADKLTEGIIKKLLPKLIAGAIVEHKVHPATYPKVEVIKANEAENWQIRVITCEIPEIDLGNYRQGISGLARSKAKEKSKEEKENEVIQYLIDTVKVKIPSILIEEEVNTRLARLLERIEKLGLSLESYLASVGKDVKSLREEYWELAQRQTSLDLILEKIAQQEKVKIEESEVAKVLSSSQLNQNQSQPAREEQKRIVESILRKRTVLDSLSSLM